MAVKSERPYVVYPPGWPHTARARSYATLEAAKRASRKIANETGGIVVIDHVPRFGGRVDVAHIIVVPDREVAGKRPLPSS